MGIVGRGGNQQVDELLCSERGAGMVSRTEKARVQADLGAYSVAFRFVRGNRLTCLDRRWGNPPIFRAR